MTPPCPVDPTDEFLPTRHSLLSRLKDWDDAAGWREFLSAYGRFIFAVARRNGLKAEEAEDVLQETLLSVAKKMPGFKYREKGSFKAWLMVVVKSRVIDYLRKKYRRLPEAGLRVGKEGLGNGEDELESRYDQHAAIWEEEWKKRLWEAALDRVRATVPSHQFQVFELCVVREMAPSAVGNFLKINMALIYLYKHRVSKLVTQELQRLGEAEF